MQNKFHIEYFRPKYLQKADIILESKLTKAQNIHHKKEVSLGKMMPRSVTLWKKVKHRLHIN